MLGIVLLLILAAIVSQGARNLLRGLLTLVVSMVLLLAGCAVV